MDILKEVANQATDEKKMSVIQKYWHIPIIILLIIALYFKDQEVKEANLKILNRADEQLKVERERKKEDEEFEHLLQRYDKQTRILNPNPESFSNDKKGKHEKDGH